MGNNCCVREDYIDENLLFTKNIDEILEVIEERNLDFLSQHIEIGNYLSGKSDYLSIQFMKFDNYSLEKKAKFARELHITAEYCIKNIKTYKKKLPFNSTYRIMNHFLEIANIFNDEKFELSDFYQEFNKFIDKYKHKKDRY